MDRRFALARSLEQRMLTIGDDLGGLDTLSGIQRSLLERFIHVEALAVKIEGTARAGEPFDTSQYLAAVDRVLRLGQTLGLHRVPKRTPSLAELISAHATDGEADSP